MAESSQFDPDIRAVIDEVAGWGVGSFLDAPLSEIRALAAAEAALGGPPAEVADVEEFTVRAGHADVRVRVYRPYGALAGAGLLWIHGGGWVTGSLEASEPAARQLASASGIDVFATEYRLAPEHPYPSPLEDCYAVLTHVARRLDARRLAVGGDSAGANLAAALALLSRDRNGPRMALQLLAEPVLAPVRETDSWAQFGSGGFLEADELAWMWTQYLAGSACDGYAAPLLAPDLLELPPAHITVGACDPVRDDAREYAERLRAHGVDVTYEEYEGLPHGVFTYFGRVDRARAAVIAAARAVRRALRGP